LRKVFEDPPSLRFGEASNLRNVAQTVFPKNGKQMAIMVKPAPGFAINL
jgi:hypothetical protein